MVYHLKHRSHCLETESLMRLLECLMQEFRVHSIFRLVFLCGEISFLICEMEFAVIVMKDSDLCSDIGTHFLLERTL